MSITRDVAGSRRTFLSGLAAALALPPLSGLARRGRPATQRARAEPPASPSWRATLAPAGERGEQLVVSGTVFGADGATPLAGVLLYAYHTDASGLYRPDGRPGEPRLRGWVRTDAQGRYELRTIRPAPYPGGGVPAHVHMVASGGGYPEQNVEDLWFEGDPYLSETARRRFAGAGRFNPICRPRRGTEGWIHCTRDIRLSK